MDSKLELQRYLCNMKMTMTTMTIQGRLLSALTETEVALFTDEPTLVHFKFKCAVKASAK